MDVSLQSFGVWPQKALSLTGCSLWRETGTSPVSEDRGVRRQERCLRHKTVEGLAGEVESLVEECDRHVPLKNSVGNSTLLQKFRGGKRNACLSVFSKRIRK